MADVAVLGGGAWGTALAQMLALREEVEARGEAEMRAALRRAACSVAITWRCPSP